MKKIFALFLSFSIAGLAMAQNSKIEEARRVIRGGSDSRTEERGGVYGNDDRRYEDDRYPASSRQARINEINNEYRAKIQAVRNNRWMSANEKERRIRILEEERARKIREVNAEYRRYDTKNSQSKRYEDRRYDDDDRHQKNKNKHKKNKSKGNNGKHLGWEKGKGNPHKGRG